MADYNSNDEDEEALAILREREEEDLSAASAGAKQVSPAVNAGASSDERPSLPARLGEAAAASASAVLPFEYNSNDEDEDDEALAILRERDEEDWYAAAAGVRHAPPVVNASASSDEGPSLPAGLGEAAAASASAVGSLPAPLLTLSLGSPGEQAVAAEAWSELVGLDSDARRQHLHWTHVRTGSPSDRQPDSFTREGFWIHLCQVYREVFPEAANASGSILLFGAVAKELHAHAADEAVRREHHMLRAIAPRGMPGRPLPSTRTVSTTSSYTQLATKGTRACILTLRALPRRSLCQSWTRKCSCRKNTLVARCYGAS